MAPRWPKRAPRQAQDGHKTAPQTLQSPPRAPYEGPKRGLFRLKGGDANKSTPFVDGYPPTFPQEGLQGLQEGPKMMAPRGAQEAPSATMRPPSGPQAAPRGLPGAPKTPQEAPGTTKRPLRRHRMFPKSPLALPLPPSLFQHSPDHLNSAGRRFWMGWWGMREASKVFPHVQNWTVLLSRRIWFIAARPRAGSGCT